MTDDGQHEGIRILIDGGVARITLDRPRVRNAIDIDTMEHLADQLEALATDDGVRCLLITGAGKYFCTGADLSADYSHREPHVHEPMMAAVSRVITAAVGMSKPVIAAVNGPAAGVGASIAFAADLVIASQAAYFLLPFTGIGLIPDGGATATVAASIGRARAMRLALRQERLPAQSALDWGLIAEVCEPDELEAAASDVASQLTRAPRKGIASTKAAINAATIGDLKSVLDRETDDQLVLLYAPEYAEAIAAFREKRPPVFRD